MRNHFFYIFLSLLLTNKLSNSQIAVKVTQCTPDVFKQTDKDSINFWHIEIDSVKIINGRIDTSGLSVVDRKFIIEQLLKFEGDERLCCISVQCYSSTVSKLYFGSNDYSIQLQALFLINQLYFNDPFNYSPYPVLYNVDSKSSLTIQGSDFKSAFEMYRTWNDKIQNVKLGEFYRNQINPLDKAKIRWY